MIRPPPGATRTYTPFPDTTLFRSDVGGRADVLHLDAGDLHAPRRGGVVDHVEQARVDLVALRQGLVEVHRAHDGAQVRGHEVEDGIVEIGHLIGGLGGVEHVEKTTPSVEIMALSLVMISWPGMSSTCSITRSEEHTSELQLLMRIPSAVFRLKQKICYHTILKY